MSVCIAGVRGRSRRADLGAGFWYSWTRLLASIRHIGVNVRQGGDKARKHPANNPYALFKSPVAIEDVLSSPTCGAAAAVVCSDTSARRRDVDYGVVIAAMALRTDRKSSSDARDMPNIVGYDLAETTARAANENTCGGRAVTNPSGGLLSKGHPLGATGVAQCVELTWLRHTPGRRQVDGARVALHHNLGLGGACVVGVYQRV
jgi:sterol carrier protein 2